MSNLLGHLALQYANHPENWATSALHFILERSKNARTAMLDHLKPLDVAFDPDIALSAQVRGDLGEIPDLVGKDTAGRTVLIIEAKFWAGLTKHQPVGYIERLAADVPTAIVFVAPAKRIETLWPELHHRCRGLSCGANQRDRDLRWVQVGPNRVMALTSWRALLRSMEHASTVAGEHDVAADVRQLENLCERMDAHAFLPLRGDELSPMIGRRITQFCDLVDHAVAQLELAIGASTKGLKAAGARGRYTRNILIKGNGCCLYFTPHGWANFRETPVWLKVADAKWQATPALRERFRPLEREDPPRLLVINGSFCIPIVLPLGVEESTVLESIVQQVREVAELLPAVEPQPVSPPEV